MDGDDGRDERRDQVAFFATIDACARETTVSDMVSAHATRNNTTTDDCENEMRIESIYDAGVDSSITFQAGGLRLRVSIVIKDRPCF